MPGIGILAASVAMPVAGTGVGAIATAVDAAVIAFGTAFFFIGEAGSRQAADDLAEEMSHNKEAEGENKAKSIEDILEDATETTNNTGVARNFEKSGGFEKTLEDFNALNLTNVKDIQTKYGLGKVGDLEDGTSVVARPGSRTGGATLEITVSSNKIYKIRY